MFATNCWCPGEVRSYNIHSPWTFCPETRTCLYIADFTLYFDVDTRQFLWIFHFGCIIHLAVTAMIRMYSIRQGRRVALMSGNEDILDLCIEVFFPIGDYNFSTIFFSCVYSLYAQWYKTWPIPVKEIPYHGGYVYTTAYVLISHLKRGWSFSVRNQRAVSYGVLPVLVFLWQRQSVSSL